MAEEELEQTTQQIDPGSEVDGIDQDPDQAGEVAEQNASTGGDDGPPPEECPPCKSGAPAWMATFADMATLLMAFFVLILSFAEMNVPKFKQISGSLKKFIRCAATYSNR